MKRSLSLFAAVLALGATAAAQSRADTIPSISFAWTSITPVDISASQWTDPNNHGAGLTPDASGGVFFIPQSGTSLINQETQVAAANIALSTTAAANNPDQILAPPSGTNYAVTLQLNRSYTDIHGNPQTAVVNITFNSLLTGTMTGSYTDPSNPANTIAAVAVLHNSIHDISYTVNGGPATDVLVSPGNTAPSVTVALGDASVDVTYDGYAPVQPNQSAFGAISFDISPAVGTGGSTQGGPTTNSTPEPSGVVLGCLGLSCLGGVFWRARRRNALLKAAVA